MEPTAYIYKITNILNGMQYVGVTVNPKTRFVNHCRKPKTSKVPLKNAIQKYGKQHFKMELLVKASQQYCYALEAKIISALNTLHPSGYNLCKGGRGSLGLSGKMNGCYGRVGDKHPHFGKSGFFKGRKHSEETKAKMRKARLGRKHSEEAKRKIELASQKLFSSAEHIEKMKSLGFGVGRFRKNNA